MRVGVAHQPEDLPGSLTERQAMICLHIRMMLQAPDYRDNARDLHIPLLSPPSFSGLILPYRFLLNLSLLWKKGWGRGRRVFKIGPLCTRKS